MKKVIENKYLQEIHNLCVKVGGNMKYMKMYVDLVIKCLENSVPDDEIFEKHHIMCKCLGGPNDKENYVRFTTYDHIVAHLLLGCAFPENKDLVLAAFMMINGSRNFKLSSNELHIYLKKGNLLVEEAFIREKYHKDSINKEYIEKAKKLLEKGSLLEIYKALRNDKKFYKWMSRHRDDNNGTRKYVVAYELNEKYQESRNIVCFDEDGNYIKEYTVKEMSILGIRRSSNKCSFFDGNYLISKKYLDSLDIKKVIRHTRNCNSRVIQLDLNYNYVNSFDSCIDAERKLGIPIGNIKDVCNKRRKRKTSHGFIWMREPDYINFLKTKTNNDNIKR